MRRALLACLVVLGLFSQSGCYYGHLASGQLRILWRRQPIAEALVDPAHSEQTRSLLSLVDPVRATAREIGLEVGEQYTSYVAWPGDRIVTTLARTRRDRLESVPFWFPIIGHLPYKGYFDRDRAEAEAEVLRSEDDYDVCVSGVTAYSTLGWIDDPVTEPMLGRGAASFVETLFHEWVHATAFLPGEADFNESVAQFIGQQAALRFFAEHPNPASQASRQEDSGPPTSSARGYPSAKKFADSVRDRRRIGSAMLDFRDRVAQLDGVPDRARQRGLLEAEARQSLRELPLVVYQPERVAKSARLSDACIALRGTYIRDLPRHDEVYTALGSDLPRMIERLRLWAEESRTPESFFDVAPGGGRSVPDEVDNAFLNQTAEHL